MGFRQARVQTQGTMCITDGGMETVLLFHRGIDLPCFAALSSAAPSAPATTPTGPPP